MMKKNWLAVLAIVLFFLAAVLFTVAVLETINPLADEGAGCQNRLGFIYCPDSAAGSGSYCIVNSMPLTVSSSMI